MRVTKKWLKARIERLRDRLKTILLMPDEQVAEELLRTCGFRVEKDTPPNQIRERLVNWAVEDNIPSSVWQ